MTDSQGFSPYSAFRAQAAKGSGIQLFVGTKWLGVGFDGGIAVDRFGRTTSCGNTFCGNTNAVGGVVRGNSCILIYTEANATINC